MTRILSLFSGIGGLDAAVLHVFGGEIVAHCEAAAYCQRVLDRHWPDVPCYSDVRQLTGSELGGVGAIDCICGGFPCQDLSLAGKRAGLAGEKSGLWFEYLRLVRELLPGCVIIENVPPLYRDVGLRRQVEEPLRALGYKVLWTLCKASDVGAPHRRERTFALAWLPGFALPPAPVVRRVRGNSSWGTPKASFSTCQPGSKGHAHGIARGYLDAQVMSWPTSRAEDSESCGAHRGVPDTLTAATRWSTPTTRDRESPGKLARGAGSAAAGNEWVKPLGLQCMPWPTPTAACAKGGQTRRGGARKGELLLGGAVRPWGTPCAAEYKGTGPVGSKSHAHRLDRDYLDAQAATASSHHLSADWVECLMGLPVGWTLQHGERLTVAYAPSWPASRMENIDGASPQHDWEPPRVVQAKTEPNRHARLKALGNAVVPQQAVFALSRLLASAHDARVCPSGSAQGVLL